jgi:HKD family nuclease
MGPEIDRGLGWAVEADIATAFVTPAALKGMETALRQRRSLKLRILVGLYQRFTPPQALAKLLSLRKEFPGRLSVRVARNIRFHWKLYAFRNGGARIFFVGSANLTKDGMTAEGELCVKITAAARDTISKSLKSEFDKLWQDDEESFELDGALLSKYQRAARPPVTTIKSEKDNVLRRLLKQPKRLPPEQPPNETARPRICLITSDVRDETMEIVEAETDWDRRGWRFVAYQYKTDFDKDLRARVLLLVTSSGRARELQLELVKVKGDAMLNTPDGKYFLAYARVPYSRARQYDDTVKSELADAGLKWNRIKRNVSLDRVRLGALCRILHVKPERVLGKQA